MGSAHTDMCRPSHKEHQAQGVGVAWEESISGTQLQGVKYIIHDR